MPVSSLMTSIAPRHPTMPETAPKTGNSRRQSAGGSGYTQARHGVWPGTMAVICASSSYIAHSTIGLPLPHGLAIQQEAFFKQRRAIRHHIRLPDQLRDVGLGNILRYSDHLQAWI